jgi:soluble lytic murein transglycosylase-like protein
VKCRMQNAKCRNRDLIVFAFCILHSAFFLSCARTSPSPSPAPPAPQPPAVVESEPLPVTIEEAQSLKGNGKLALYERGLKALALSDDPKIRGRALALLGLFEIEQKRFDEAVATLSLAADEWPSIAPFLRLRIVEAEQQRGNVPSAIAAATQIIATSGSTSASTIARLRLPGLYAQTGDATSTDAAFQQVVAAPLDELSEGEFVTLAATLEKAGRQDLATAIRMRLLGDYPQGRFTERTYGQIASLPDSPLDRLSLDETTALASRLAKEDHYDEALALLGRSGKRFPEATKSPMYRTVRIRALFNSRHYSELLAETAGEKLDPALTLTRARAAWRAGNAQELLAGLRQVEKDAPSSKEAADARLLRAKYYTTDETNYETAIGNLEQAISAGAVGNDGENVWTLGWTYFLAGRDDAALRIFTQYLQDYPDGDYRTNSLFWSGKIYAKRGDAAARDAKFAQLIAEYPFSYYAYRAKELGGQAIPPVVTGGQAGLPVLQTFPDVEAETARANDPRVQVAGDLASIDLMRDATREMKLVAAAHPDNLGLAFALADLYVRAGEPFKANGVLQRRFRQFVRHGGSNIPERFWQILFPLNYWDAIRAEAAKRNVDPYLLASIIRQESGFEPTTVSNAGAVGLMQIMPAEAAQIATRAGIDGVDRQSLFDPSTNIAVGAAEYAQKLATMQNNPTLAIAAYNAGEDAVGRWLAKTPLDDPDVFIESIPYAETKLYVKTVTRNRSEYLRIYEGAGRQTTAEK